MALINLHHSNRSATNDGSIKKNQDFFSVKQPIYRIGKMVSAAETIINSFNEKFYSQCRNFLVLLAFLEMELKRKFARRTVGRILTLRLKFSLVKRRCCLLTALKTIGTILKATKLITINIFFFKQFQIFFPPSIHSEYFVVIMFQLFWQFYTKIALHFSSAFFLVIRMNFWLH